MIGGIDMAKIVGTYSPCCGIFRTGDAEEGIMHCAMPHERQVIKLVDVKEIDQLERTFRHTHVAGEGKNLDWCKTCGMNFRDPIHIAVLSLPSSRPPTEDKGGAT